MKHLFFLVVLCIFFAGCSDSPKENKAEINKENEAISVVEKYLDASQRKDFAAMDSILADNYMSYGPSFADSIDKKSQLKDWAVISQTYYDSIEFNNTSVIGSTVSKGPDTGDFVSVWSQVKLYYKDSTRKPITTYANVVYKIENGKIVKGRRFYNEADIMRQAGHSLVPGQ